MVLPPISQRPAHSVSDKDMARRFVSFCDIRHTAKALLMALSSFNPCSRPVPLASDQKSSVSRFPASRCPPRFILADYRYVNPSSSIAPSRASGYRGRLKVEDWFYAGVRSTLNTGRRQGFSALQAIEAAINGQPLFRPG